MTRRELFERILALASCGALAPLGLRAAPVAGTSAEATFSFAWLQDEAHRLSLAPFEAPEERLPAWIADLDWDAYQSIRFLPEHAVWAREQLPFQVQMFHLGLFYKHAVGLYEVVQGVAKPIRYARDLFAYGQRLHVPGNVGDIGFAGFRVYAKPDFERDMFSFLGASYFRAVGDTKQYGMSARGLAVDTGLPRPEEFPEFRTFWLERPAPDSDHVMIYALLDSPSVTGAYAFVVRPGGVTVMDIEATLFPRMAMERVGIAPRVSDDFRPEIHDADGLCLHAGSGEWIWRPSVNAPVLRVNSFLNENPKGFGLLQRDRNFDHYQDDGALYHLRPSVWVEPIGDWGKGAVQLVEIPTADETFDNIVAFWSPADPFAPGQERHFRYRLYWGSEPPMSSPPAAQVISTRIGAGGIPGQKNRVPSRKFVIDFEGDTLARLPANARVTPVITASRGSVVEPAARPLKGTEAWRCNFDLISTGKEPIDLRCYLSDGRGSLTETWLYQWTPLSTCE